MWLKNYLTYLHTNTEANQMKEEEIIYIEKSEIYSKLLLVFIPYLHLFFGGINSMNLVVIWMN
jgi:hypothetical protein